MTRGKSAIAAPRRQKRGATVRAQQAIQRRVDSNDKAKSKKQEKPEPMQAGTREYPVPPLPKDHLAKPGHEADLSLQPMFDNPDYKGSEKLKDRVAIITGGDSGIGRSVAVFYAREGADVAIVYLSEDEDAEATKEAVEAEGQRCLLIPGDVSDSEFCKEAVAKTVEEFGRLDILVNNAAFQEHVDDIADLTPEHFDRTLKTNLYGYFYMAQAAVAEMKPGSAIIMNGSARLLHDKGRHSRLHSFAGDQPREQRHPRQCGGAGSGLDAPQPRRQIGGHDRRVWGEDADAAARPTRGNRARLRLPRRTKLFKLHHRRSAADHWRLYRRLATPSRALRCKLRVFQVADRPPALRLPWTGVSVCRNAFGCWQICRLAWWQDATIISGSADSNDRAPGRAS
jgi:short chain dehydrogenase